MKSIIDKKIISEIVRLANQVPTGDNCQPFRFKWDGKKLEISVINTIARHHYNFKNCAVLFSLGMLLESINIASKHFQLETSSTLNLTENPESSECATLHFKKHPSVERDNLFDAIDKRVTDRRRYQGGKFETAFNEQLNEETERFARSNAYLSDQVDKELFDYIAACDSYSWLTQEAHQDIFGWIRYSSKETEQTRDGMPWESLAISYLDSRLLKISQNYKVAKLIIKLGGLSKMKKMTKKLIDSSAGLCCVTTKSMNLEDLTEAGRLTMRLWLLLTKMEWGVQPLALNSLFVFSFMLEPDSKHFNLDFHDLFNSGHSVLRSAFSIPENEYPCWVFRTGFSPAYPDKMRTPRLPVERILELS